MSLSARRLFQEYETEPNRTEPNRTEPFISGTGRNRTRKRSEPNRTQPRRVRKAQAEPRRTGKDICPNRTEPNQRIVEKHSEPNRIEPNWFLPDFRVNLLLGLPQRCAWCPQRWHGNEDLYGHWTILAQTILAQKPLVFQKDTSYVLVVFKNFKPFGASVV